MPKLKQLTASGQAAVESYPGRVPSNNFEGQAFLGNSIAEIGQNLGIIAGDLAYATRLTDAKAQKTLDKLQKQQDELDITNRGARYDAGLKLIEDSLVEEPDPRKRPALYVEKAQALFEDVTKDIPNDNIRTALQKHIVGKFPQEAAAVIINSRKQFAQGQVVELQNTLDMLSNEAARQLPNERNEYIRTGVDLIARSPHFPDEKAKSDAIQKFSENVQIKQAEMLLHNHQFTSLRQYATEGAFNLVEPNKLAKILEDANNKQHSDDVRRAQVTTQAQNLVVDNYYDQANHGRVNKTQLERDPMVPNSQKAAILQRNDNPIYGDAGPIRSLVQEYMLGERTVPRIKEFRRRLNELNQQFGGLFNAEITKFGDTLQTDQTAADNSNTAKIAAGIKLYEEDMKARTTASGFPRIDKLNEPKLKIESGEDKGAIYRGEDPAEVVKRRMEKRKKESEAITGAKKTIQELLKAR